MRSYKYKLINLNYLRNKQKEDIIEYIKYCGGHNFKGDDADSLISLIKHIKQNNSDGFVISYSIDRIDKEFDLIKIGNNNLVNIEMKVSNRPDKIKQVIQNYKILSQYYSNYNIYIFSYICNDDKLLIYNPEQEKLIECDYNNLNDILMTIYNPEIVNINIDIRSVYENPEFFLEGNYILSTSQEKVKDKITNENKGIFVINGCGGTGKTLLALDLYNYYSKNNEVIFLLPALTEKVISPKLSSRVSIEMVRYFLIKKQKWNIIIVDEAQRLTKFQLESLNELCDMLILFYDPLQDIDGIKSINEFIDNSVEEKNKYTTKQIIRNDSTMDRYARKICGLKKSTAENKKFDSNKIQIYMYDEFIKLNLNSDEYKMIKPTKSKFKAQTCYPRCLSKKCDTISKKLNYEIIHYELGKEHNNILIFFCDGYNVKNNKIISNVSLCYGDLQYQLYTIISRAIEKVVLVCDNIEVYNFLMKCREDLDK